ncbi:hypothetical protein [Leptospira noguchii]|uniref:hypothetical protein n=1 Tax=Leptospira noguchii TaxID=28182 RepID=UPI001FB61B91|nr:hypothetical protein [Leptospira noguchii]UOG29120.1 hypothetical protein MAL06_10370 [Leptospira noguchii]
MFFTKAFETKAKGFLRKRLKLKQNAFLNSARSLLRSVEVTQRLTSMGRSTGRV